MQSELRQQYSTPGTFQIVWKNSVEYAPSGAAHVCHAHDRSTAIFHLALHFLVPAVVAAIAFRKQWQWAYLIMVATMLVDLDHLLADPIYDPGRCSIGFHPLHKPAFIALYAAGCFFEKTRIPALGLMIHMLLDSLDCQYTNGIWLQP